jgi:hypothetical protein
MIESILAEVPDLSAARGDWHAGRRLWARRCLDLYRAHPWALAATAMRRQVMGPHQLGWLVAAHAALEPTGLPAAQRHQVFVLVVGLARSLAQQAAEFHADEDREWNRLAGEVLERHAARFPALTRAIADGAFEPTGVDPLDFGLDRILDGVEALMAGAGMTRE